MGLFSKLSESLIKTKDKIQVTPSDVNFKYVLSPDNKQATFEIPQEEFYRDITVTFPDLDK